MKEFISFENIMEKVNKHETVLFIWNDIKKKPSMVIKDNNIQDDGSVLYCLYDSESNENEILFYYKDNMIGLNDPYEKSILSQGTFYTINPLISIHINDGLLGSGQGMIRLMKNYTFREHNGGYMPQTQVSGIIFFNTEYDSVEKVFDEIYNSEFMKSHPKIRTLFYIDFLSKDDPVRIFEKGHKLDFEYKIDEEELKSDLFSPTTF